MAYLSSDKVGSSDRRLSLSEPDIRIENCNSQSHPSQSFSDRLSVAPLVSAIRRLSGGQQVLESQIRDQPDNDYFQQIYRAQHAEKQQPQTNSSASLMVNIKNRLSPASIGSAIRRLSGRDTDLRATMPPNEYLQQLHNAAIAEQNAGSQHKDDENTLDIVNGIKYHLGSAVRRLSTYAEDPQSKMSAHDTFQLFQQDSSEDGPQRRHGITIPDIIIDNDSGSESGSKKKSKWKKFNLFRQAVDAVSSKSHARSPLDRIVCD